MTDHPDTAAIRASVDGVSHAYADLTRSLCDALDAARAELAFEFGMRSGWQYRAEAAEARIAAALALHAPMHGAYPDRCETCRALTGGTE